MKNDTVCEENASNVFLKEREQYFEIQYLKAQLQDKDIAIRKLLLQPIRNQPVVRQPTAYKFERSQLPRHGVSHDLTKPVTPHSWPQVRKSSFAKPYDVNAPGPSRNSPKHAEAEALPTNDAQVVIHFPEEALLSLPNSESFDQKLDAPWAFRAAYKTPIGTTPYKLLYGKTYHLQFKIEHRAYWALRDCNPDLKIDGEKQFLQLHELDELRIQAYENSKLYKARTKSYHDKKLKIRKEFKAGDNVLLFNSKYKFKAPKLRTKWHGSFVVKHGYPSGYVDLYDK
ncbi:hypothetical protein Tco_0397170 [Tanacetum coccineum]